jgi:hemolysin activation/secretion protein
VFVRKFKIEGNTVFSEAELAKVTAPYENREITLEDLQVVRQALTLYYVNTGYINSGAIIPDQPVIDGIITLRVIEGKLAKIEVGHNKKLREDYIRARIALGIGPPVNVFDLQKNLQLIQQNPRVRRVNAELSPGIVLGESVLKVRVEEERPYHAVLKFGNNQSPSIGGERGEIQVAHQNLFGYGDTLTSRFGLTQGLVDIDASYAFPLTARDTTLTLQFRKSESDVIEDPFSDLDLTGHSETYGITLSRPFYKTTRQEFSLALTAEHRHSETFLLGRPFSFTLSEEDGKADETVLRFSQEWTRRSQQQVMAARSRFSVGIDAFGATINDTGEDGRFLTWLGQFQWARRLGSRGDQFIFRADTQLSTDPLLPLERFAVGGVDSVRGYRENQLVRDNAFVASLEFRVPIPLLHNRTGESTIQLAPFVDVGSSWNAERPTREPKTISSAGVGLRWAIASTIHLQVYWGYAFEDIENPDHDIQDEGVHFQITSQVF